MKVFWASSAEQDRADIIDYIGQVTRTYPTANEAKLALFDDFWAATQDDERLWASD